MKKNIYFTLIVLGCMYQGLTSLFAAGMYLDVPKTASSNREPFPVTIFLDTEGASVSGVGGELSFSSSLFDIKSITAQNSVIPLWVEQPQVSTDKTIDQKTHIVFEGAIPGGFSGVYGLYEHGVFPGIVFTVLLVPKNAGKDTIILTSKEIHAYDEKGTLLPSYGDTKNIIVPELANNVSHVAKNEIEVEASSVTAMITTNDSVAGGDPYVFVNDENTSHIINHIEVAETGDYDPHKVSLYEWHKVNNPHVITYTNRTKYTHVKVVYANGTYAYKTIAPVENSSSFSYLSRILVYIIITILLLYHYGKNFLHIIPKNSTKHT